VVKAVQIRGKTVSVWILCLIAALIGAAVAASVMFGEYLITYKITPVAQAPTLTPNPVNLDLGEIVSGSSGEKDFGKTATLSLPASWDITFSLNTTTLDDFESFEVTIAIYWAGTDDIVGYLYLYDYSPSRSRSLVAGDYDLYMEIEYTAKSVTSTTTGTVKITISYPG